MTISNCHSVNVLLVCMIFKLQNVYSDSRWRSGCYGYTLHGLRSILYIVVTHRLGSGTGSGCKYRELVSEVRQGAVLNLFLPRMRRTVDFLWREG